MTPQKNNSNTEISPKFFEFLARVQSKSFLIYSVHEIHNQ